mmetsp:Transcript_10455/g.33791  ORF Transcript_10455/g.33791 Transcript_10455/m.33791 type:complete len:416 (-) Transcript_10455:926-2173(-)
MQLDHAHVEGLPACDDTVQAALVALCCLCGELVAGDAAFEPGLSLHDDLIALRAHHGGRQHAPLSEVLDAHPRQHLKLLGLGRRDPRAHAGLHVGVAELEYHVHQGGEDPAPRGLFDVPVVLDEVQLLHLAGVHDGGLDIGRPVVVVVVVGALPQRVPRDLLGVLVPLGVDARIVQDVHVSVPAGSTDTEEARGVAEDHRPDAAKLLEHFLAVGEAAVLAQGFQEAVALARAEAGDVGHHRGHPLVAVDQVEVHARLVDNGHEHALDGGDAARLVHLRLMRIQCQREHLLPRPAHPRHDRERVQQAPPETDGAPRDVGRLRELLACGGAILPHSGEGLGMHEDFDRARLRHGAGVELDDLVDHLLDLHHQGAALHARAAHHAHVRPVLLHERLQPPEVLVLARVGSMGPGAQAAR